MHRRPPVAYEQAKSKPARPVRLRPGQNQQHLAAAVCDKSLNAMQEPVAIRILIGPQFYSLQIRSRVRFSKHHRACHLARRKIMQIVLLDILIRECVDSLSYPLEPENIHQRSISPRYHFIGH